MSGKEHLSIGISFYDHRRRGKGRINEFNRAGKMDAQSVAAEIRKLINTLNIDANKCMGQR